MVLQFHIVCGIVSFFALFLEVSAKDEAGQTESFNLLWRGWVCCVIDGIFSRLFYFRINNKTRMLIDFVNCNKELKRKV